METINNANCGHTIAANRMLFCCRAYQTIEQLILFEIQA